MDAFVVRPLTTASADPKPLLRTLLVASALAVAVARRGRRAEPTSPADPSGDPGGWVARLVADQAPGGPTPLAAHVGDELCEVFWDGPPGPVRPPWRTSRSGWVSEAARARLAARRAAPLGTLVPLGPTSTGTLWLNLGAFRLGAVVGEPDDTTPLTETLLDALAGVATPDRVETVTVHAPSEDRGDPLDLDRVLARLGRRAARRPRRHRRARRWPPPAPATPLVVAVRRGVPPEAVARLVDATTGEPGVTVLVDGDARAADLRLTCRDGRVEVSCLGDVTVAAPPRADRATPSPAPPFAPALAVAPTLAPPTRASVRVCVLGSVEVHGTPGPRAAKCLELVAYLACHPEGVPDHQIRAALWPDRAPTAAMWSNRVCAARKALGVDADGEPYLRRFRRHVGRLAPAISTDLAVIETALGTAATAHPTAAADALAAALTEVRGRPFDLAGYGWAEQEGHVARCERVVVDAAHHLVELALAGNDPRRAVWAVAQGVLACPQSETLREDAARARAAAHLATRAAPVVP